ncbi:MAG: cobalamin-dependent protein [Anaerolineales bacterium]|nr:cobalamin-dependent protein [Anaerolineales bacterium]
MSDLNASMKANEFKPHLDQGLDLINFLEANQIGRLKQFKKERILFWQGDPVESIFIVKQGAIKLSSISIDGKTYTYSVLGHGGLAGAEAFLVGKPHSTMAEAIEDTETLVIPVQQFQQLLSINPEFSLLVMKKLAEEIHSLTGKVRDFSLLDVQHRLKSNLIALANEHGYITDNGIRIDLDLTHEEIGEMVAANRTTITACLSELRRQGFLWTQGRRMYIIPPDHIEILDNLDQAVVDGSEDEATHWALQSIENKIDPLKSLEALTSGMRRVDRLFARDEIDVSDVILAAYAMKSAIPIIEQEIDKTGITVKYMGTIVIGTVQGDIHDIGRTLVTMLLKARGFKVVDLGSNVSAETFLEAVKNYQPQILAMSTLMTTTTREPFKVIEALTKEGLRKQIKVIVGGSAISEKMCQEMGADGYEPTAHRAVELAWRLTRTAQTE